MREEILGVLVAGIGALLQEFVHWWNLRYQLSNKRYSKIWRSPSYWIMVIGMIVVSGIFTFIWYYGDGITHQLKEYMLTGVSFPLILKHLAAAAVAAAKPSVQLGDDDGSIFTDYLLIRSPESLTKAGHNE